MSVKQNVEETLGRSSFLEICYYWRINIQLMIQENYSELQQTTQEGSPQTVVSSFAYLLVNSSSGSRVGDDLIKSHIKEIKVSPEANLATTFFIYDLYDEKERNLAFEEVKNKCKISDLVYVIICGGDGTIEWVIQESLKSKIEYENVIFSVLPIGTGNDFAKSVGWGDFDFVFNNEKLELLAIQLNKGKIGQFDIWESNIECYESGTIVEIKNGEQVERPDNTLTKNFTNYFGIGTDAQVAYIAQKLKAKTAGLKRVAYGFAGFLSFWMFCGGLKKKITHILQKKTRQLREQVSMDLQKTQNSINMAEQLEETEDIKISNFDCCVTFLNSTSSMDLVGIWKTPHKANSKLSNDNFKQQCVNDGMIEIVSYRNEISLWFERFLHMAKKVGQGKGPYIIKFKQPKPGQTFSTYVHINGEPYKINNPKSITVSQSSQFPSSKIRVLYRQK